MSIYHYSLEDATRSNERDLWRESYQLNVNCARDIEKAINENYDGSHLSRSAVKGIIDAYGIDRVNWVLANTLQQRKPVNQFSQENRQWADQFAVPQDTTQLEFVVKSHPGLVNVFVNQAHRVWKDLNLFDHSHCTPDNEDFDGKVLVLYPTILKDEYKSPDYQLFLATGGFGCSPTARGRRVYGQFLKDGEETSFYRQDFLGVLKDEHLPDWAREKLAEVQSQAEGPVMT